MHWPPVIFESLEFELDARLLADKLVRPGADRLLHEAVLAGLLVILSRHRPGRPADIRGSHQDRKIEERLLEMEADGAVIGRLDIFGLLLQHLAPGTAVV